MGGVGSGSDHKGDVRPFCFSFPCGGRVSPHQLVCPACARHLPAELAQALDGLDSELLRQRFVAASPADLETAAQCLEAIAEATGRSLWNQFRGRLRQLERVARIAAATPANQQRAGVQARLLEELPADLGGGAYGPAGRRQ